MYRVHLKLPRDLGLRTSRQLGSSDLCCDLSLSGTEDMFPTAPAQLIEFLQTPTPFCLFPKVPQHYRLKFIVTPCVSQQSAHFS